MAKRKVYKIQASHGANAERYAFNSAQAAGQGMVRDYAAAMGIRGTWEVVERVNEGPDRWNIEHAERVWQHEGGQHRIRIVINLVK